MRQLTINPNNRQYYSEDFIKGFNCGAQRQFEADKSDADRPQGKWIRTAEEYIGDDVSGFYDYHWACSECEKEAIINEWNIYELSDYCPHCGAYMKGADDE